MTCALTPELPVLLQQADEAALERLAIHVEGCAECRAELEGLLAEKPEERASRLLSDLLLGLGALSSIAIILGVRGVADALNKQLRAMGGEEKKP